MTLGNMREQGMHNLIGYCLNNACGHSALIDVSAYPDHPSSFQRRIEGVQGFPLMVGHSGGQQTLVAHLPSPASRARVRVGRYLGHCILTPTTRVLERLPQGEGMGPAMSTTSKQVSLEATSTISL
jgi:hypothetical protein